MTYKVFVDDNFNYMDESERYGSGEYESYDVAVTACKAIVDEFIAENYSEGMSADDLNTAYVMFGEDPFIRPEPEGVHFSARDYAKQRCSEICKAT